MARVPEGASLIDNAISRAPGFMIENVIVMAGVPNIMQVMLDDVSPRLEKGRPMVSRSVRLDVPEGDAADGLGALQAAHPEVQIGSYPFFQNKRLGTYVVLRSTDEGKLAAAEIALWKFIAEAGLPGCLRRAIAATSSRKANHVPPRAGVEAPGRGRSSGSRRQRVREHKLDLRVTMEVGVRRRRRRL